MTDSNSLPLVLVHGGGFDSRCWDLVLPTILGPVTVVDLPGRGRHRALMESVDWALCADTVAADVSEAGYDDLVLVGHSLAGCSIPSIVRTLGARVRRVVLIACTVPRDGESAFDTLDPEVQQLSRVAGSGPTSLSRTSELAQLVLGSDLTNEQAAWCAERMVPEAPRLVADPVSLAGFEEVPKTWVLTARDEIVSPQKQRSFANRLANCHLHELDTGHMCMVSHPALLGSLLNVLAVVV